MDKFQKRILYNGNANPKDTIPYCFSCEEEKSGCKWQITFNPKKDEFIIFQNEDIFSTVYYLYIKHTAIESISSSVNNTWIDANKEGDSFKIALDFDNKATEIKLTFKHEIAEDYIFKVVYKDANKERYYKCQEEKKIKEKEERQKNLDKTVNIEAHTGNMLVNINFNPCSSDYERAVIELYRADRLMAKYDVEKGMFFKAITGLAYGYYAVILKQYNSQQELIYESKSHRFDIHELSDNLPGDTC